VQILDKLFGPQTRNLERALDRTTLRHGLLSANLANVNTPGYKRRDTDFAIELEGAEQKLGDMSRIDALRGKIDGVTTNQGSVRVDGNSVDLESEVADIANTEMRYMVLTDMTARYFSNLKSVIKEGK